ncbi:MAG: protein translocase subunit SecD [bacterium]|nr:protein translocase subunit SecD [bacterium]
MNRSLQIRAGLSVVVLLLSLIGLWPTFKALSISGEERAAAKDNPERLAEIQEIDSKAIRRGLDLKGGMYLVLEIDQTDMTPAEAQDALQRVKESLVRRIDKFGVSEPEITTFGASRIVVKLPGLQDPERAKNLLGKTARLEFRLVRPESELQEVFEKLDRAFLDEAAVAEAIAAESSDDQVAVADSTANDPDNPFGSLDPNGEGEDVSDAVYLAEHPFTGMLMLQSALGRGLGTSIFLNENDVNRMQALLDDPRTARALRDVELQLGDEALDVGEGIKLRPMYLVDGTAGLTGDRLEGATANADNQNPGRFMVSFTLDSRGARQFAKLTGDNVNRLLAISLDGRISSAPQIQGRIPGGQGQITGSFTNNEASDLALLLRAGALPADVYIAEERTVGPSLGSDSIKMGLDAAMYGSILVVIFMLIYYRASGLVTVLALVSNIVILMSVLAQFGLVLTLPGIAGIILTVGMAVDANVLINERIREELRKDKTVRAAVQSGYMNATRTIVDANVTTLIAGGILLMFGTGPIKGFAVTLSIGILTSMFTALVMTRVLMETITRKQGKQTMSI